IARTARPFGEHYHWIALADELACRLVRLERRRTVAPLYRDGSDRTSPGAEDRDPEQFGLRDEAVLRQLRTEHEHVVPGHVVGDEHPRRAVADVLRAVHTHSHSTGDHQQPRPGARAPVVQSTSAIRNPESCGYRHRSREQRCDEEQRESDQNSTDHPEKWS